MDDEATGSRHSHSGKTKGVGVYDSAEDALNELFESFNYWSSQVTATSVQMCYAVIGANWVVFTSVGKILNNAWAMASLTTVLLALTLDMESSLGIAEWMRRRFEKAMKIALAGTPSLNGRRTSTVCGPIQRASSA